ncbi:hypothetical protein RQP46_002487 [Phenoliferia psychrophenolica]
MSPDCASTVAFQNRIEQTALAHPLGIAHLQTSIAKWHAEYFSDIRYLLSCFVNLPDFGDNKRPLIVIHCYHDSTATDLLSQWRPTSLGFMPLSNDALKIFAPESQALVKIFEKMKLRPENAHWGPVQLISLNWHPAPGSEETVPTNLDIDIEVTKSHAPCSLDPSNKGIDWLRAAVVCLEERSTLNLKTMGKTEDFLAYYFKENDEFNAMARAHWAKLSPDEQEYYKYIFPDIIPGFKGTGLVRAAYMSIARWGQFDGGWIPQELRAEWAAMSRTEKLV